MLPPIKSSLAANTKLADRQKFRRDQAEKYIRDSLCYKSLTIRSLCRELNISKSTLFRLFEKDGGVEEFIITKRLEAVRDILATDQHDIGLRELAQTWHFADAAHLIRRFKARFGSTPKRYRYSRVSRSDVAGGAPNGQKPCVSSPHAMSAEETILKLEAENRSLKGLLTAYKSRPGQKAAG